MYILKKSAVKKTKSAFNRTRLTSGYFCVRLRRLTVGVYLREMPIDPRLNYQ